MPTEKQTHTHTQTNRVLLPLRQLGSDFRLRKFTPPYTALHRLTPRRQVTCSLRTKLGKYVQKLRAHPLINNDFGDILKSIFLYFVYTFCLHVYNFVYFVYAKFLPNSRFSLDDFKTRFK